VLGDIEDEERNSDMFLFPDYCIANKAGSHWDKALLAYGLYSRLIGSTENTYIALGESSSYLVFMEEDQWKYLDCRYNVVKDFLEDDIYAVFNKEFVYNKKLNIGEAPDFIR
jgi:anaerobic ribonucleoside-triphosphate reductase